MLPPLLAIYGLGRLGRALAAACLLRGLPVAVGARTSRPLPPGWPELQVGPEAILRALQAPAIVLLAVPDDALPAVAAEFARLPGASRLWFAHASGLAPVSVFKPLAEAGALTGGFHPLQSFAAEDGAARVPSSWCALAGAPELQQALHVLCDALGMRPFVLRDDQRPAYHAAAVLAGNALTALLALGQDLLLQAGLDPKAAREMLLPLVRGTLDNVQQIGPTAALTGPVVRGDVSTIKAHLGALSGSAREAYCSTMRLVADLAERSGRTSPAAIAAIRVLLA